MPIMPPTAPLAADNKNNIKVWDDITILLVTANPIMLKITAYTSPASIPHNHPLFSELRAISNPAIIIDITLVRFATRTIFFSDRSV